MNPKERMKAAMDLKPVDKTPVMCQLSTGHILIQTGVSPCEFWFDKDVFGYALTKVREIYDFDGILISLRGHFSNWRDSILSIEKKEDGEYAELQNGDKIFFPFNDLPQYTFAEEIEKPLISDLTEDTLPPVIDYIPVSQDLRFKTDLSNKFGIINDLVKSHGEQYSIHGEIASPFDYVLDLLGHQEALMALLDDPGKCKMILNHFAKLLKQLAVEMCGTGVDAIKISSPFAGAGFISPDDYKEFVLPFEKEIVEAIREKNVHVYVHTCGAINDRLELMFETGISGIECLDPFPLGNVELKDAVERISGKGFIKGNIDSVNTLLNGTKEEIIKDVTGRISIASTKAGFILSTACSIAPEVKRENIRLLKEVVDKWK